MKKYFIFLFTLLISIKSFACSCNKVNIKKSYKQSSFIFIGKVISVEEVKLKHKVHRENKEYFIESDKDVYTFEIEIIFKGEKKVKKINISTNPDSTNCGYHFEKGKKYLVYSFKTDLEINSYLDKNKRKVKPFYTTTFCTRTKLKSKVKAKEFKKLARYKRRFYKR